MPATVEKKLPRLKSELELGLSEGTAPLLPETIRKCAGALYSRISEMIYSPPDRFQKIRPAGTKFRDYRNDPRVRESFILKLVNNGVTEVYAFLFGHDKSVTVHQRVESDSWPINNQPWEQMKVLLSVKEDGSRIVHESQGVYGEGEDRAKKLTEENNTTAAARAEMLVERLDGLWSAKGREASAPQKQVKRNSPLFDKFKATSKDLFNQIKNFADSSESPRTAEFKKEYPGSDIIILDLAAGPNSEYTDAYTIEVGHEAGVVIMYRRRNLSFQPIENHPWEQLLISTAGGGIDEFSATHRSCGIKEYGEGAETVEVKGTTAWARGELLVRRFKDDLARNTSSRVTSPF